MRPLVTWFCVLLSLLGGEALGSPGWDGVHGIIENRGQAPADFAYVGRGAGQVVLFAPDRVQMVARDTEAPSVMLLFPGQRPRPRLQAFEGLPGEINIIRGRDPAGWLRHLRRSAGLRYRELFDGVDWVVHLRDGALKTEFVVAPGASPEAIRFHYRGARDLRVDPSGALQIDTGRGLLTEEAPLSYQEDRDGAPIFVASQYFIDPAGRVGFKVDGYDPARPLTIDPGFRYFSYLGGKGSDRARAVATDKQGNAYIVGSTSSTDFPKGGSAAYPNLNTNSDPAIQSGKVFVSTDAFVMKITPQGQLAWATYLGGKTDRFPHSICASDQVDSFGNCFPMVASPWGLGGPDLALGVAVTSTGEVVVVGETLATDFPLVNPFQNFLAGSAENPADLSPQKNTDAFYAKLKSDGSALLASSYLGGSRLDIAKAVAIDNQGFAWVVGRTSSTDFPTADPIQSYMGGPRVGLTDGDMDGFATRVAPDGACGETGTE